MGLDCSHDAFSGAYSAFNRLRQEVCRATGGSFPPHWLYTEDGSLLRDKDGCVIYDHELADGSWYFELAGGSWFFGEGYDPKTHPGLMEFLSHSDCDGEISPEMCTKVADELEALLPKVEALNSVASGHLARNGGYVSVLQQFIKGCREAADAGEPLEFM